MCGCRRDRASIPRTTLRTHHHPLRDNDLDKHWIFDSSEVGIGRYK